MVATLPVALAVFFIWPPPTAIADWFAYLQSNRLVGVINLDLVLLIDQVLFVPIILALYVTLRRVDESLVLLGTVGGLIGAVLLMVSREATFSLLSLSDQYAMAADDAQRAVTLAAGQTLLTAFNGTSFSVGYALVGLSGLLITSVMLRSSAFSKATARWGIATYALAVLPPTIGPVGLVLSLVSLVPLVPFLLLLARRFFQLAADPTS